MRIYDRKGMLVIPPPQNRVQKAKEEIILVEACYCQNGHNLIGSRVYFNGLPGIFLKARSNDKEGCIGLSPVYGEKCRVSLDVDLVSGELMHLLCPTCEEELPAFASCSCGGKIIALFLNDQANFADSIGVCNRVDCHNAAVKKEGELLALSMVNSSKKKSGMRTNFKSPI